jgi:hypothetical protein
MSPYPWRVEAALDSLRREVKPKNEKTYHLMAETSIDLLQSLRSEIDASFGITPLPENADRKDTEVEGGAPRRRSGRPDVRAAGTTRSLARSGL